MHNLLIYIIIYYIVINIISFLAMLYDKRKAIKNEYRVSEKTLFYLALALGGVGIYTGMIVFRHKTKHMTFKVFIPLIIILNFTIIGYIILKFIK